MSHLNASALYPIGIVNVKSFVSKKRDSKCFSAVIEYRFTVFLAELCYALYDMDVRFEVVILPPQFPYLFLRVPTVFVTHEEEVQDMYLLYNTSVLNLSYVRRNYVG